MRWQLWIGFHAHFGHLRLPAALNVGHESWLRDHETIETVRKDSGIGEEGKM
jgi:hypothetical protein